MILNTKRQNWRVGWRCSSRCNGLTYNLQARLWKVRNLNTAVWRARATLTRPWRPVIPHCRASTVSHVSHPIWENDEKLLVIAYLHVARFSFYSIPLCTIKSEKYKTDVLLFRMQHSSNKTSAADVFKHTHWQENKTIFYLLIFYFFQMRNKRELLCKNNASAELLLSNI